MFWQLSKETSKFFFQMSLQVCSLLGQTEGKRNVFLWSVQGRGGAAGDYPQEHLVATIDKKISSYVKFENIPHLLCYLINPITNKYNGMEFYDKFCG